MTVEEALTPSFWRQLHGFALIQHHSDAVPIRAAYAEGFTGYEIGVNPLHSVAPSWYAVPEVFAATLLTGKPPLVLEAWTLKASGTQLQLRPVALRGDGEIDPAREDSFQRVIELRKEFKQNATRTPKERERQQRFLKLLLANSGSYER